MPLRWRRCLRYFHYHMIAYLCCKIENMVYTKKDRILYKWVPQSCDVMLYEYLVRPKVYPFSDRIFHLMVFMRVYRGSILIQHGIICIHSTFPSIGSRTTVLDYGVHCCFLKAMKDIMSKKKKRKESADYETPGMVKRSGGVAP